MKLFRKRKIIYGCAAPGDQKSAYLTRWELLSSDFFAIYLHRFERSDDRSSLHDHPWNFITIPREMFGLHLSELAAICCLIDKHF
jgi:hypothetical protein